MIAFCAALQNTSFSALGPAEHPLWTFNSAMTTGNIRNAVSGWVFWLMGREPEENRGRAIVSASVLVAFATGAIFGGFSTRLDSKHALAPCVLLVLVGFLLTWRQRIRYRNGGSR